MKTVSDETKAPKKSLAHEIVVCLITLGLTGFIVMQLLGPSRTPRAACLSHVRQLSKAIQSYAADSDDTLPPYFTFDGEAQARAFYGCINQYAKNPDLFLCPFDRNQKEAKPYDPSREGVPGLSSYTHCLSVRGLIPGYSKGKRVLRLSEIDRAGEVPLLRDPIRGTGELDEKPILTSPQGTGFAVGFFDGHVKSIVDIVGSHAL